MKPLAYILALAPLALGAWIVYDKLATQQPFGVVIYLVLALLFWLSIFLLWSVRAWQNPARRLAVLKVWVPLVIVGGGFATFDFVLGQKLNAGSPGMEPDAFVHHRQKPSQVFRDRKADNFDITRTINRLGLRGPETTLAKPADTYRILMLGDSMVAGKGVQDNQTSSALLGQKLKAPAGKKLEVLNAGVDSYSPLLSHMQYQHYLQGLSPDLVVYNFDMSDLEQNDRYLAKGEFDAQGEFTRFRYTNDANDGTTFVPGSKAKKIRNWLDRNLFFTRFVLFKLDQMRGKQGDGIESASTALMDHTLATDQVDRAKQWAGVFKYIGKLRQAAEKDGAKFLLTATPWPHQVSAEEWPAGRGDFLSDPQAAPSEQSFGRLQEFAQREGMDFAGLLAPAKAHKQAHPTEKLYFAGDPHPTPRGVEVYADFLAPFIQDHYLK